MLRRGRCVLSLRGWRRAQSSVPEAAARPSSASEPLLQAEEPEQEARLPSVAGPETLRDPSEFTNASSASSWRRRVSTGRSEESLRGRAALEQRRQADAAQRLKQQLRDGFPGLPDARPVVRYAKGEMPSGPRLEFGEEERVAKSEKFFSAVMADCSVAQRDSLRRAHQEWTLARDIDVHIPTLVNAELWRQLGEADGTEARLMLLLRRSRLEMRARAQVEKNKESRERIAAVEERRALEEAERGLTYGLGQNTIFNLISNARQNASAQARAVWAARGGDDVLKVALDLHSLARCPSSVRRQALGRLNHVYSMNMRELRPGRLWLTSAPLDEAWWREAAYRSITFLPDSATKPPSSESLAAELTRRGPSELGFPAERVVLVSQDAQRPLHRLRDDTLYVVPAHDIRQTAAQAGTDGTLRRAKKTGIRGARLPIDELLQDWPRGHPKALPPERTLRILLDVFRHGDWLRAFQEAGIGPFAEREKAKKKPSDVPRSIAKEQEASIAIRLDFLLRTLDGLL